MQHMREAVGIEEVLRVVRTANLTRPNPNASAGADPQSSFNSQKYRRSPTRQNDGQGGPVSAL
jgi:hypothetical protein